jgi:mannose-6-phosphate isomerase-like protein (cupin superfamily)
MSEPAPHDGELHPDADELLIVVSGRITVLLEEPEGERRAEVLPGQGFVVPRGVWHRVLIDEPTQLIAMTPGPRGEHRLRSEVR